MTKARPLKPITVSVLINLLQDCDPDMLVFRQCSCRDDKCYHTISNKDVVTDYVTDEDGNEWRAVIIGDDI